MLFYDRHDGHRVRDLDPFERTMPYIMRGRNEAAVYFSEDLDIEEVLLFTRTLNEETGQRIYGLFHVILAALVQILVKKPKLNRFVSGKAIYQRRDLTLSFIVKKHLSEEARETNAKISFMPDDTIESVANRVNAVIEKARSEELTLDEKEMSLLSKIPGGLGLASTIFRLFNHFNVAPRFMLDADPLFASIYVANLASINLATPFHHLYEWGTTSIFFVIGRMERRKLFDEKGRETTRHFVNVKISLDERIADGLYFAHSIDLFRRIIANPTCLRVPARDWELVYGVPCVNEESREISNLNGVSEKTGRVVV